MFPTSRHSRAMLCAAALMSCGAVQAGVYGFEDLIVPAHVATPIPAGYAGATWTDWMLRRTDELQYTGLNGNDLSTVLATAWGPVPAIQFAAPVRFDGVFLINPKTTASFDLYLGGTLISTGAVQAIGSAGFVASGYSGAVDRVVFNYPGYGISIDDVSVSAVPEPSAFTLSVGGLALIGGALRRRIRQG